MQRIALMITIILWVGAGCGPPMVRVSGRVLNPPAGELDRSALTHNAGLVKKGWDALSEDGPCGEARADTHYFVKGGQVALVCETVFEDGACKVRATIRDPMGECSGEGSPGDGAVTIPGAAPCARSLTCRVQVDPPAR